MKKIVLTDTVSFEISRKLRVARVKLFVFPVAKIAGKKTKISRNLESEDFLKKLIIAVSILFIYSGLTALVRKGRATSIFSVNIGNGIGLF